MIGRGSHKGFTMIEMLIVLAIIGILSAVASVSLVRLQRTTALRSAANEIGATLNTIRSQSRNRSINRSFNAANGGTSYTATISNGAGSTSFNLPAGVTLVGNLALTFQAPYGVVNNPNSSIQVTSGAGTRTIRILGLNGKVVVSAP